MSDQQWVLHWLIYVGADETEAVVVTDQPLSFEDGGVVYDTFDPSNGGAAIAASSFVEFIHRFWIENELWFRLNEPDREPPLSRELQEYVAHYGE